MEKEFELGQTVYCLTGFSVSSFEIEGTRLTTVPTGTLREYLVFGNWVTPPDEGMLWYASKDKARLALIDELDKAIVESADHLTQLKDKRKGI